MLDTSPVLLKARQLDETPRMQKGSLDNSSRAQGYSDSGGPDFELKAREPPAFGRWKTCFNAQVASLWCSEVPFLVSKKWFCRRLCRNFWNFSR